MLTGSFIAQLKKKNCVEIPAEILTKLDLKEGDKIEVSLKRIRTGKFEIRIAKNPLAQLIELARERENQ